MSKFIEIDTSPFTKKQLRFFRQELERADGSDNLMKEKEALIEQNGSIIIATHKDIFGYKEKYLTGVYEPLREFYNTEVPLVFWNKLYTMLCKVNPKVK